MWHSWSFEQSPAFIRAGLADFQQTDAAGVEDQLIGRSPGGALLAERYFST
jgi:hypothetical protein